MTRRSTAQMLLLTMLLLLAMPMVTFGKAAYWPREEMIKRAEIIALVEITKLEPTETKGKGWTYSEVATATVERVLKGELPKHVKLYGKENFICAQVRYKPGKFLLFLRHDQDLLVGVNWHLGVRPVTGDTIEWLSDENRFATKEEDLATVLQEIETVLKQ